MKCERLSIGRPTAVSALPRLVPPTPGARAMRRSPCYSESGHVLKDFDCVLEPLSRARVPVRMRDLPACIAHGSIESDLFVPDRVGKQAIRVLVGQAESMAFEVRAALDAMQYFHLSYPMAAEDATKR